MLAYIFLYDENKNNIYVLLLTIINNDESIYKYLVYFNNFSINELRQYYINTILSIVNKQIEDVDYNFIIFESKYDIFLNICIKKWLDNIEADVPCFFYHTELILPPGVPRYVLKENTMKQIILKKFLSIKQFKSKIKKIKKVLKYKKELHIDLNAYKILKNINTYIDSGDNNEIKNRLNELLNGTLDLSEIKDKEKDLLECIMLFGIPAEFNMNDSCKNKQIYKVYELRF